MKTERILFRNHKRLQETAVEANAFHGNVSARAVLSHLILLHAMLPLAVAAILDVCGFAHLAFAVPAIADCSWCFCVS